MSKELEIERKFLLKRMPKPMFYDRALEITQYYLPKDEDGYTVRIRETVGNGTIVYHLTKKKCINPMVNEEIEKRIDGDEFNHLKKKALTVLSKKRYLYTIDDLTWEIDEFNGMHLIIAEIELPSEDYNLVVPKVIEGVLIKEVSGTKEFYNQQLSEEV
jgi:CYTH domain-containing protein